MSLDGGGVWSLLQVMALQDLYGRAAAGHDVLREFDLVVANSGGATVVGGLVENLSLADIFSNLFFDQDWLGRIFAPVTLGERVLDIPFNWVGVAPRYQTASKLAAIKSALPRFGGVAMASLRDRLSEEAGGSPDFVFTAFNLYAQRAAFFRSNQTSLAASSAPPLNPTLAEAIHASSTAPIRYFDAPAPFGEMQFWDGAIAGLNNPVLIGVIEALANGAGREDILALAIGSASTRLPVEGPGVNGDPRLLQARADGTSIIANLEEVATSILDDPPDEATFEAHMALGQPLPARGATEPVSGHVVRMNPMIQPVRREGAWVCPEGLDEDEFNALATMQLDARQPGELDLIEKFGQLWLEDKVRNQPVRSNSDDFRCEIGQDFFSEAKAAWRALTGAGDVGS